MNENSVYIVTPPDLQLLEAGPTITVLSEDPLFIQSVERVHESIFKTVPINLYHTDGTVDETNLAWTLSVMRLSDNVFVDLDTASNLAITSALVTDASLVMISQHNVNKGLIQLLNSIPEYTIYKSPEDYLELVVSQIV